MTNPSQRLQGWPAVLFNITFVLNCMLLFLLLFESRVSLPAWLQVAGRMHPLLLHFPLVLVVVYAMLVIIRPASKAGAEAYSALASQLLLVAAFTAVTSALMGLFLSKEEGYDAQALWWHKWGGVAIALLSFGWYWAQRRAPARRLATITAAAIGLVLIVCTGHLGAAITHGEDFLLGPFATNATAQPVALQEAEVYRHMVRPILEQKCMPCHNHQKAKGGLIMETEALLLKGGKNGKLWDTAAAGLGLLLQRVHLPLAHKEHMPPKNKPQLTEDELSILEWWIEKGSDFKLKVAGLPEDDALYAIARDRFDGAAVVYDFPAADAAVVNALNTANRVVKPASAGSPALSVNFFNAGLFDPAQLNELKKVSSQVVSLSLAQMPVKDEDLQLIAAFSNLRRLNLSFTGVTGSSLSQLKQLKRLESLSLSGTGVTAAQLAQLRHFPALKTVYVWNTAVTPSDIAGLKKQFASVSFETGFRGDTVVMKLSPPVVLNEQRFFTGAGMPLQLKHYVKDAVIRYTTDGSEPDSLRSMVYKGTESVNVSTVVKARAYKPGWISSDVMEVSFLRSTFTPDSVIYLTPPDPKYRDERGRLLIDREQGDTRFQFGNWVGFRANKMECLLVFNAPVNIQRVGLNSLVDVGSYIMPAAGIEVWGGDDPQRLRLLGRVQPEQPLKAMPAFIRQFECAFNPVAVRYVKVVAHPVARLPLWHPGKGDKGWVFADEVLVN